MSTLDNHTKLILARFSNVDFFKLKYGRYSETWDHEHCEICGIKIVENPRTDEIDEGYSTDDKYTWICPICIQIYTVHAKWNLYPDTNTPEKVLAIEANKNLVKQEYDLLYANLKGLVEKFADVNNYINVSDIRSKDEEYKTQQNAELKKFLFLVIRGRNSEAKKISFL